MSKKDRTGATGGREREQRPASVTIPSPPRNEPAEYTQCPVCYPGLGGVGTSYGHYPPKGRVYLRCNCCGHTWSADLKVEVVAVDHRLPGEISERISTP